MSSRRIRVRYHYSWRLPSVWAVSSLRKIIDSSTLQTDFCPHDLWLGFDVRVWIWITSRSIFHGKKKVSNSTFCSETAAVLCKLKITWFLLPPSHTFQNSGARLKLTLKLFFRAARCYFPIVATCFDFFISFETVDLEPNYIKTLHEVREFVIYFKYRTLFLWTLRFSHLGNITDLQCK